MSSQYGELRPTNGWDLLASLGHPYKFQWVSRLGSVTARHSSSKSQPNFAALNRGCHLYSAGRPSRWALAHISSFHIFLIVHRCIHRIKGVMAVTAESERWTKCGPGPHLYRAASHVCKSSTAEYAVKSRVSFENGCNEMVALIYKKLVRRWDSERELFTMTSYMQRPAPTPVEPTS